jgi:hypothetical protein
MRLTSPVRLTRFRVLAFAVVGALAALAGISVWRMRSLGDLPDVGDPFDVALALQPVVIADGDNAYVAYAAARINLAEIPEDFWDAAFEAREGALTWSKAKPGFRAIQKKNRAALEIWREGSERPDALFEQPAKRSFDTILTLLQEVFIHSAMAALEGSRLEEQGAMAEAWQWYQAMLRSSRMVERHGALVERRYGAQMHELAARCILRWAADPRVDAGMLRRALDDALVADRLTPPLSDAVKSDYLATMRELGELNMFPRFIPLPGGEGGLLDRVLPGSVRRGFQQFRFRASNETERSRRAFRLLFANWLAQVDKPAADRATNAMHAGVLIYDADPTAPPAARTVSPETLSRAIEETLLARSVLRPDEAGEKVDISWEGNGVFARERRRKSVLILKLAAELYRRERGERPANAGALLKTYLEELPQGVGRDDPIPTALEPNPAARH